MDIQLGLASNNFDEVRGRTISRDVSMSSTKSSVVYHERITTNNANNDDVPVNASSELSYETEQEKAFRVSKAANQQDTMRTTGDNNEASMTYGTHKESVINIQLPYSPQAPTEPDLWSGSFHPILLHGLIEHFALDLKNIKDSLNFIAKFPFNKQVNSGKANELNDFNGMSNAIWNFISLVYEAKWDTLFTDNKSTTLRSKISSKFTPKVAPNMNKNNKEVTKLVPISIKKAPPPPLLPAKSKNEVNTISKYFQGSKPTTEPKKPTKSYTQASKQSASTSEVLKIKESFPALNTKQIDQVNNIVKGNQKFKPCIQMTMKELSKKQIIVSMSNDNNNAL